MEQRPISSVRRSLPKLVFESVLIVFSILLALAVSECSERSDHEERAKVALRNINAEIDTNAAALRASIPYHREMSGRLSVLLRDSAATLRAQGVVGALGRVAPRGLEPPTLSSTAWEMAIVTNAVARTEYGRVYDLSRLYQLQQMGVEQTVSRLSEFVFSRETFREGGDPLASLRLLELLITELVNQERYLLDRYEAELKPPGAK